MPVIPQPSRRRRLIVHIGTAKAGSTSIQHALAGLSRRLSRAGVHVPKAGRCPTLACHNDLARALDGNHLCRPGAGDWADLLREVRHSRSGTFALSAEAFTGRGNGARCAGRIDRFAAEAGLDVSAVAYLRPQWQHLEAYYAQVVANGLRATPFEAFVSAALAGCEDPILDYEAVLAPWRERFGGRVLVQPLERCAPAGRARGRISSGSWPRTWMRPAMPGCAGTRAGARRNWRYAGSSAPHSAGATRRSECGCWAGCAGCRPCCGAMPPLPAWTPPAQQR